MSQLIEFAGNHLILVGAFFFIIAMLVFNLMQSSAGGSIAPLAAVQMLNREDAVPLDVRSKADFEAGHIINAVNIPMAEMRSRIDELKKFRDRPLLVYCASGSTSRSAVRDLQRAGFERVYSLKGGVAAWRSDSLPLT